MYSNVGIYGSSKSHKPNIQSMAEDRASILARVEALRGKELARALDEDPIAAQLLTNLCLGCGLDCRGKPFDPIEPHVLRAVVAWHIGRGTLHLAINFRTVWTLVHKLLGRTRLGGFPLASSENVESAATVVGYMVARLDSLDGTPTFLCEFWFRQCLHVCLARGYHSVTTELLKSSTATSAFLLVQTWFIAEVVNVVFACQLTPTPEYIDLFKTLSSEFLGFEVLALLQLSMACVHLGQYVNYYEGVPRKDRIKTLVEQVGQAMRHPRLSVQVLDHAFKELKFIKMCSTLDAEDVACLRQHKEEATLQHGRWTELRSAWVGLVVTAPTPIRGPKALKME